MNLTLRFHELAQDTSPEEAGLMKQQSRVEAAKRLRNTRMIAAFDSRPQVPVEQTLQD